MTDIVERLRTFAAKGAGVAVLIDAAAEIETLRFNVEQYEQAIHRKNEELAGLRNVAQAVTGHPRHNVYFMCQCCEEENPENAVCCREDIAVMPDGTWLCDNCYSDCEKTAYGLVASDIEDFEFPQFEDLPRPAPYIDLALTSAERA
jgi:hypothetical protein